MVDEGSGKMGEKNWLNFSVLGRVRLLVLRGCNEMELDEHMLIQSCE